MRRINHCFYVLQIVICSALGFDTYLVMRHGVKSDVEEREPAPFTSYSSIPGDQLGCYFCNDVVAPGNVRFTFHGMVNSIHCSGICDFLR
jgi:hypothetical protein